MTENNLNEANRRHQAAPEAVGNRRPKVFTHFTWLLLIICLVQLVLLATMNIGRRQQVAEAHFRQPLPLASTNAGPSEPYFLGHPGPWGELKYARISLEPPDAFVPTDVNYFGPTGWFFEGYTPATLHELFGQCGLTPDQLAKLTDASSWSVQTNGVLVKPGDELILSLAEPARQQIYSALAKNLQNQFMLWPFKSQARSLADWFGSAEFSDGTLALLKKLVYHRSNYLCFSDLPVVYARIPTVAERQHFLKWFARTPTLLMKLKVQPGSDVSALADYWAKGARNKDIEALLCSLTNIPGGMTIDVAHLLPPFARQRLYTFINPPAVPPENWPNCSWTSMNFFRDPPDDRYYDFPLSVHELEQNFTKVRQPTFGDVIIFYRPDGFPIHAVVYIADDVVFTKNGISTFHPWVLMKWADLAADYTFDYTPVFLIFHPKAPME